MGLLISALLSALLQVVAFSAIPILVHRIGFRKRESLAKFLGLYAPEPRSILLGLAVASVVLAAFAALNHWLGSDLLSGPNAVASRFKRIDSPALAGLCMLLSAYAQTALAEEVFFRGFVAKRLIAKLGSAVGNTLQALIFGAIHVLLVLHVSTDIELWQALCFGLLVALGGANLGYITEVKGNGSIVPAWIVHGTLNLVSYLWVRYF